MKAIEQYFPVVLFIMLYKMVQIPNITNEVQYKLDLKIKKLR